MARRKKKRGGDGSPAWLITFSDLMTLLLTFFVLLLSMAVIDERAKLIVLGSVTKTFGAGQTIFNPLASKDRRSAREPGAIEEESQNDLAALRDMLIEDVHKDLNFQENKFVQIFSINSEVLFAPGSVILSSGGIQLLDEILPFLQRIAYPLLVAGHTAPRRDEEDQYTVMKNDLAADSTWQLSFGRAQAVYRHLIDRGIASGRLSLEAFGQFHPRWTNNTPEGRHRNRRVDLVLDKRNLEWIRKVEDLAKEEPQIQEHIYKGFRFTLTMPGESQGRRPNMTSGEVSGEPSSTWNSAPREKR